MLTNQLPEAAQPTLRCPGCKHTNPAHSNFCNICGRGLPSVPCPQCGELNDLATATMCTRCGGPLTDRADSEAAKDARLRVIEAAMGGGFPPMPVATPGRVQEADAKARASLLSVDVDVDVDVGVDAVAAPSRPPLAAVEEPEGEVRRAATPDPEFFPTLTAAIPIPTIPPARAPVSLPPSSTNSAVAWSMKPAAATAPLPSGGPPAPSLARMPRTNEAPAGASATPAGGSASSPANPTLADFGPSGFSVPQLHGGHSANSAPFVLTGWRTEEPQQAEFDMRQITELVRTSLAAETVPMLPALSSGGAAAHGESEPPPGHVSPRPRRLVMAGGVAALVVVAVFAYRVYAPARVPELAPVPLAGGAAATTATATATEAVDRKAAQMQASLDRAADLLAQRPTSAGGDAAALAGAASASQPPGDVILPTTLAPAPQPVTRTEAPRAEVPRPSRPTPSRETAQAAARPARSPAAADNTARPYSPPATYGARPAPAIGPCTEGVAALGLCDTATSPATNASPRR
ncbi:hypothetical protein BH11PSE8_BH11PSE8_19470 [soil metagenome]